MKQAIIKGPEISTRISPAGVVYTKRVIRIHDISTGAGTPVGIGAEDVAIYCDRLIDVVVGESPLRLPRSAVYRIQGQVKDLRLIRVSTNTAGRVVIFSATPSLGIGWRREDPNLMGRMNYNQSGLAWGGGVDHGDGGEIVIPNTFMGEECMYLYSLRAERSANIITKVEYVETETGVAYVLWTHQVTTGAGVFVWENPGRPVRLPSSGKFRFYGPVEVGATTIDYDIEMVYV